MMNESKPGAIPVLWRWPTTTEKTGQKGEAMYQVGQIVNIGYYDGFHHTERILNKARITKVHPSVGLVEICVYLNENGSVGKKMFGLATDLERMEENYRKWKERK